MNSESLQPDTFTLFLRLPRELRFLIWELALPKGRMLSLHKRQCRPEEGSSPVRFVMPQPELPLLRTCHESRITVLKVYQERQFQQLGQPFYYDLKTDAILFNGIELISAFCFDHTAPFTPVGGIANIVGVSLARPSCSGVWDGQLLVAAFWRGIVIERLCSLMSFIGTVEAFYVVHPQCLGTDLEGQIKSKLEKEEAKRNLGRSSSNGGSPGIIVPVVICQDYEDSLDYPEAEHRLRELMER